MEGGKFWAGLQKTISHNSCLMMLQGAAAAQCQVYLCGFLHGVRLAVGAVCACCAGRGASTGAQVLVGGGGSAIGAGRLLLTTTT